MRLPYFIALLTALLLLAPAIQAQRKIKPEYYQLETYHFSNPQQELMLDDYLKDAYLPALHRMGLKQVGVFKPITNDTASQKKLYVLLSFPGWQELSDLSKKIMNDKAYQGAGNAFLNAPYNAPAYQRKEITLAKAFSLAPAMQTPLLSAPLSERIYELRSYESANDNLYKNKVQMFNEGGEIALFKRLGFNAIFYGEVVSGARMPNLIYMTSFNNMNDRNEHWKAFGSDPEWKSLSGKPEYQHNVSKADIILTRPAPYSDY